MDVLPMKPILDACCGGRSFWHDKKREGVVFMDCRSPGLIHLANPGRTVTVSPDVIGDFRDMPFADDTFRLVVFDPPHAKQYATTGDTVAKYGRLDPETWQEDIRRAFLECFRVLDPAGFLIFKWCETQVPLREVLALTPEVPLFGDRRGLKGTTHWQVFAGRSNEVEHPECDDCGYRHGGPGAAAEWCRRDGVMDAWRKAAGL